ncbi:MAG: hypothetical protein AAF192_19090 [Pseudomonadota bacterium]
MASCEGIEEAAMSLRWVALLLALYIAMELGVDALEPMLRGDLAGRRP